MIWLLICMAATVIMVLCVLCSPKGSDPTDGLIAGGVISTITFLLCLIFIPVIETTQITPDFVIRDSEDNNKTVVVYEDKSITTFDGRIWNIPDEDVRVEVNRHTDFVRFLTWQRNIELKSVNDVEEIK